MRQVFILRCQGEEAKRIAKKLDISKRTVELRVTQIRNILSLPNIVDWIRALSVVEVFRNIKFNYLESSTWPQVDLSEKEERPNDPFIFGERLIKSLEERKKFFETLNGSGVPWKVRQIVLYRVAGWKQKKVAAKLDMGLRTVEQYAKSLRNLLDGKDLDYWVSCIALAELYFGRKIDAEDEQSWPTTF